jgi:hypothetical protein
MGYLTEEQYEARANYAAQRMEENKNNKKLDEDTHDVLAEICSLRHEFHCMDGNTGFYTEISDYDNYMSCISEESYRGVSFQQLIKKLKIKKSIKNEAIKNLNKQEDKLMMLDNDTDNEYCEEDFKTFEEYEEAVDEWRYNTCMEYCRISEEVNTIIEKMLKEIDIIYGTDYCPGGHTRIY